MTHRPEKSRSKKFGIFHLEDIAEYVLGHSSSIY